MSEKFPTPSEESETPDNSNAEGLLTASENIDSWQGWSEYITDPDKLLDELDERVFGGKVSEMLETTDNFSLTEAIGRGVTLVVDKFKGSSEENDN